MASLFSQLSLGANALMAHRTGVATVGHNISNASSPGHNRLETTLSALPFSMGGVSAQIRSSADASIGAREREAAASLGDAGARQSAATQLEASMGLSGDHMVDAIAALFGGFLELAAQPTDSGLRRQVLGAAENVATQIQRSARAVSDSVSDANSRIQSAAADATRLTREIAQLNGTLMRNPSPDPALSDRRAQAAKELSSLVGGRARVDPDGALRFNLDNGATLVDGVEAASIETVADPARGGSYRLDAVMGNTRRDLTDSISGGRIGGELAFRDGQAAELMRDLDQLAFDFSSGMNAIHQNYAGLDGNAGRGLYNQPTQVTGAAATISVDAAVRADPDLLATADPTRGSGDNSGAAALAAFRDTALTGGQNAIDRGIELFAGVGRFAAQAAHDQESASLRADSLEQLRDSISGVSIEEELTKLQGFQRASEAATRFLSTVDGLLGNLIESL